MTGDNRRSRRSPSFFVGSALVLAGVVVLGYVGWQLFGTNYVSYRAQEQAVTDLRETWGSAADEEVSRKLGNADALLRIPRFGDDYVMPVFGGVADDVLAKGFGHFDDSAGSGKVGNYALAAHRVTHGEPLRDMPELRPGDTVLVETRDMLYTYELDTDPNELVVTNQDGWVVEPLPTNPREGGVQPAQNEGQRLITLTTCAELFHTDDRMITFGHLVDTETKSSTK